MTLPLLIFVTKISYGVYQIGIVLLFFIFMDFPSYLIFSKLSNFQVLSKKGCSGPKRWKAPYIDL